MHRTPPICCGPQRPGSLPKTLPSHRFPNRATPPWWAAVAAMVLICCSVAAAASVFDSLRQRLVDDGYSRHRLDRIYTSGLRPQFKTVARSMRIREGHLNYAQFLEPARINQAARFLADYQRILAQVEKRYGVDRHIIAALLLVETGIGRYTGKTPTLAVLSTYAVMDRKRNRDIIWKHLPASDRHRWGRQRFDEKLKNRARWAYDEIRALLQVTRDEPQRLRSLRGSPMGAVGWPQFLPSSLLRYGADGNGDGVIDLYAPADAIHSVANYLRGYGWDSELDRAARAAVIYQYNHSQPYVETVMKIAEKLRKRDAGRAGIDRRAPG